MRTYKQMERKRKSRQFWEGFKNDFVWYCVATLLIAVGYATLCILSIAINTI